MISKFCTLLLLLSCLIVGSSCSRDGEAIRTKQDNSVQSRSAEEDENEALDDAAEEENEVEIDVNSLPQSIKDGIASRYAGSQLREADKITHDDGSITYDVEIVLNGEITEVMYTAEGNFLGEEEDD